MMDPEDLVDFGDADEEHRKMEDPEALALLLLVGVPGAGLLGRALRTIRSPVAAVPAVVSAAKAAVKTAPKTAAKTAPKIAPKTTPASPNPIKSIDEALKKVETPLYIPARIAKASKEFVKLITPGGMGYLLDKVTDKGCSDSCPFLGNGEYRSPEKKPSVAETDSSVAEKEPPVAVEKEPTVAVEKKPAVAEIGVSVEKKPSETDEKPYQEAPCFYHEMQEKSDDLLYKGYDTGLKLILDCHTDVMLADSRKLPKLKFEASTDKKDIKLYVDHKMNPGMKGVLSLQHASEVNLRYRKPLAAVTASSELQDWPVVSISTVLGTKSIAWGAVVSLDTRSLTLSESRCGLYLSKGDFSAALSMKNDDVLTASCHHKLDDTTSVAANVHHIMSSNENTLTVGCSHIIDSSTTVKARLSTNGKVCVVLKRNLKPKCYVSVSAESDCHFRGSSNGTKFGLCIALGA